MDLSAIMYTCKKFYTPGFIFLLVFSFFSCGSGEVKKDKNTVCVAELDPGWVDNKTFELSAYGWPNPDADSMITQRNSAKSAAQLCAERAIVKLVQTGSDKISLSNNELEAVQTPAEWRAFIKGGLIVAEQYANDNHCKIRYRITSNNLSRILGR